MRSTNAKNISLKVTRFCPPPISKEELIAPQWDQVLRFIATIKLKEATASQLFRRLNSYSRQHPLYTALKEFGKIPKSDFLLRYTDILQLRQTIEKQLNKGENAIICWNYLYL